jgi:hypothetical protein
MLRLRLPDALAEQRDKYLAIPINLTFGDDITTDHLAVCEKDRFGNPVDQLRIPLCTYGKSAD